MQLLLGDSFAYWAGRRCPLGEAVQTAGWRGGAIADGRLRKWAIATVVRLQPAQVLLIIGGNDLAREHFSVRILSALFEELTLGLLAAGADSIVVFPIPPRASCRHGDVVVSVYRRRRRLMNQVLRRQFSHPVTNPQVTFGQFSFNECHLGRDGVHPSAVGWQALADAVAAVTPGG